MNPPYKIEVAVAIDVAVWTGWVQSIPKDGLRTNRSPRMGSG
jgi:hypothetical protein